MEWLVELIKASPLIASVISVIWLFTWFFSRQKTNNDEFMQGILDKFNSQQQQIEKDFRKYLMEETEKNRKVLEEYTNVIKAFNETINKTNETIGRTNLILEQNLYINQQLLSETNQKFD